MRSRIGVAPASNEGFPGPNALLDPTRFGTLTQVYQSLKKADEVARLAALAEKRYGESAGIARSSWELVRAFVAWWEGDRPAALERLERLLASVAH